MNNTNIVLAVVAVASTAGCLVLFNDLSAERQRASALEAQVASLQRAVKAMELPQPDTAEPGPAPTEEPPVQTLAANPAPAPAKPATSANDEWRALLADPDYRKARLADHRLRLQRQGYAHVVTELGLSEDEADRFLDLLAEQELRESKSAMDEQSGVNLQERRKQLHEQAEKERRAFLGDERYRTWSEYMNSATARQFVSDLRTQLATSTSALREEQIKPLVKALAAEHAREWAARWANHATGQWTEDTPLSEKLAYMERRQALIEESLDRQQEIAVTHLDSVQQRVFTAMLEQRRKEARADLAQQQAYLEADDRRTRSR